ncbi:MAG: DUF2281 domain-containing protein [Magnetococcales bacterium]|nr:DUF2281 domain-containing protein [Magnetococcales bacterium]
MAFIDIRETEGPFSELIRKVAGGEEIVFIDGDGPVARLIAATPANKTRQPGSAKGKILYMAPDFDAPLEDFKEYM